MFLSILKIAIRSDNWRTEAARAAMALIDRPREWLAGSTRGPSRLYLGIRKPVDSHNH
jgi:hypothetical protein